LHLFAKIRKILKWETKPNQTIKEHRERERERERERDTEYPV
jgi:hypothetical protein